MPEINARTQLDPEAEELATARLRLSELQARVVAACERTGRDASGVLVVGAAKTVSARRLGVFLEAGLQEIGENYVQEGLAKIADLRPRFPDVQFHFIGALQSNKARLAVENFDWIHSVDRTSLIAALEKAAAQIGKVQRILLQINLGDENTKAGCAPREASTLARAIAACPHLQLGGLMALPPWEVDPQASRPHFRALRVLCEELARQFPTQPMAHLSMGMSHDFEVAVEEGATFIRPGTVLFGERFRKKQEI